MRLSLLLAATLLVSAACQEPTPPLVATRLRFMVAPGSTQVGQVITPPVKVAFVDAGDQVVTTATGLATLSLATGTGALLGTTTMAPVDGIATFDNLRISQTGVGVSLAVVSPGLTGATSPAFNVSGGPPAKLAFVVQPAQVRAVVPLSVAVAVQDAGGNQVTGVNYPVTVSLVTPLESATLSGSTTVAAVDGVATFTSLSIDKVGPTFTLVATSPPLAPATSVNFAVAVGPAGRLAFTLQPRTSIPGGTFEAWVTIQDLAGNAVENAGHPVTLSIDANPGGGILSGGSALPAESGVAAFGILSIDKLGIGYTLTASADGLIGATSAPFTIRNPLVFASMNSGYFHSCGLAAAGAPYCWGENLAGQLGAGPGSHATAPSPVSGGLSLAVLSAGRDHNCGLTAAGKAYCWGGGALGAGGLEGSPVPVPVSGGHTFARVLAGYDHSCGVTLAGAGYCWGLNGAGELGNGTTNGSGVPTAVSGGLSWSSISPGRNFSCGVTTGGLAYCWGVNAEGELGDGTTIARLVPTPVLGGLTFAMVGAGGFHSCGLTPAGEAYCWGRGNQGALGSGTGAALVPRLVSGGLTFATLSVGNRHTCGVTVSGAAYCWGDNGTGMLGTGNTANRSSPGLVTGGHAFATLSAGRFHTCGMTTIGEGYCWGSGLGVGTLFGEMRTAPTRVY